MATALSGHALTRLMPTPSREHGTQRAKTVLKVRCGTRSVPATLRARRGLSLMELMIATTISIMVMGATVTLFGVVGDKINAGRAMIETNDRVRSTQNLLRRDLRGATVSFLPWEQPSAGSGYFEVFKGNTYDADPNLVNQGPLGVLAGYTQDVLMLTTRSPDLPFTGRFNTTTVESQVAEVVWFMQPTFNSVQVAGATTTGQQPIPPTFTLYRRQFLVIPSPTPLGLSTFAGYVNKLEGYYDNYDVSAHSDGGGNMIANSLADLCYRENRFAH
ncbi:MAG TPA: hypothetical protein VG056_16720, partial [Pirellulales bacterium]|nr:hypothetical protein [Pirellulales bacterium]